MSLARKMVKAAYGALPFKQPLFSLLRAVPLPTPLIRHLRFHGIIEVRPDDRHLFRMHNEATFVENDLFWFGYGRGWEGVSLRLWQRLAPRAGCILDIGANTGAYSLAARALNPDARIVAFEPSSFVFAKLRANVALNGFDITTERLAVSDSGGTATLFDIEDEFSYLGSLERSGGLQEGEPYSKRAAREEVECTRLDDYLSRSGIERVDLIKLDVEGHEGSALAGYGERLRTEQPDMLVEILSDEVAGQVARLVEGLDYRVFRILEDRGLVPAERLTGYEGDHRNFLFCRPSTFEDAKLEELLAG